VRGWTFSGTERVVECAASAAFPHAHHAATKHTSDGSSVHAFIRSALLHGREQALAWGPAEIRERCAEIDMTQVHALGRVVGSEEAYRYDPERDIAWHIGSNVGREYGAGDHEIAGATDIELIAPDGVRVVLDAKAGHTDHEPDAWQMRMQGLAVARARGLDVVRIGVLRVPEGRTWTRVVELDELDLGATAHDVRRAAHRVRIAQELVQSGGVPDVTEGEHCRYCPASSVCPAKVSLARALAAPDLAGLASTSIAALSPEQAGVAWQRAQAADKVLDAIKRALRARLDDDGTIPLGGGKELALTTVEKPWSKASAVTKPASPITEPTERSMPPVTMTMTMPMDIIAVVENERNTPIRLSVVKKYGVEKLISAATTSSAHSTFSSRT